MDSSVASLLILIALNVTFLLITVVLFGIIRTCRDDKIKVRITKATATQYMQMNVKLGDE